MNKNYLSLLIDIAHAAEVISEQVMEINQKNGDLKGYGTAKIMRNDYSELFDRMKTENFDSSTLTKQDYAKLLAATIITSEQLENKIKSEERVLRGYKIGIIPKLDRIINCESDESASKLAEEIFQIKDED